MVSAFQSVSAAHLTDLTHELDEDVLVCGDRATAKQRVGAVIHAIRGLRPLDAGGLELSRLTEGLTPLLISLNRRYNTRAGIRIVRPAV